MSDDDILTRLQTILDGRLGTMTSVVNEATRSAASAAGAAMEVRGQLAGVQAGLRRVEEAQQRTSERLRGHGEQLAAITKTCRDRGQWCDARFREAASDLERAWGSADKAWRDATKGLHGRAKRTSEEIERVRAEAAEGRAELARKLADVREDTGVLHLDDVRRKTVWWTVAKIGAAVVALAGLLAGAWGGLQSCAAVAKLRRDVEKQGRVEVLIEGPRDGVDMLLEGQARLLESLPHMEWLTAGVVPLPRRGR